MAVSLDDKPSASFCLCAFGTNNKFSAINAYSRIRTIIEKLEEFGIEVLGFSGDGDPRMVKIQKYLMGANDTPLFATQDAHHMVKNMKNRGIKPSFPMKIGSTIIPFKSDLELLITKVPRGVHGLSASDLDDSDRMNVDKALKICDVKVDSALNNLNTDTKASRLFLRLMRCVFQPFHNKTLTINERIGMSFYATFIMRGWKLANKKDEFITNNTYISHEINSHNLLLIVKYLRDTSSESGFLPWRLSSQTCESFFRRLRSFTSTEMTQTNFDLKESLKRLDKILLLEETENYLKKAHFHFTNETKQTNKKEIFPSDVQIEQLIAEVKHQAIRHLKFFGVRNLNEDLPCLVNFPTELNDDLQGEQNDEDAYPPSQPEFHDELIESCRAQGIIDVDNGKNNGITYHQLKGSNGDTLQVKKSTLLWARGDLVVNPSVDRNQRFHSKKPQKSSSMDKSISLNDFILFRGQPNIYRVIDFRKTSKKTTKVKDVTHRSNFVTVSSKNKDYGIFCISFKMLDNGKLDKSGEPEAFIPLSKYLCHVPNPNYPDLTYDHETAENIKILINRGTTDESDDESMITTDESEDESMTAAMELSEDELMELSDDEPIRTTARPIPSPIPSPIPRPRLRVPPKPPQRSQKQIFNEELMEFEENLNQAIESHKIHIDKKVVFETISKYEKVLLKLEKVVRGLQVSKKNSRQKHPYCMVVFCLTDSDTMDYIFEGLDKFASFDTLTDWIIPHAFFLIYKELKNLNDNEVYEIFNTGDKQIKKAEVDQLLQLLN